MKEPMKLTRRELLRQSAASLVAVGVWPGVLRAEGTSAAGDFYFLVVNDLHYRDARCGKWLEGVIAQMKRHEEKIDFCLVLGDLAEHGKPEELTAVRDLIKGLGKTTHVVIGNHDYRTQEDRKPFAELFPKRLNYRLEARGWQWVGLDTTEGLLARNTSVQAPTLRWLDDNLAKLDKKRPLIVFTHFPLALPSLMGCPKNADKVLERFKEYNLRAVFSGHWHGFTKRQVGQTTLTTNKCCSVWHKNHDGTKEKGYFLCHAKDGEIKRTFVEVKPG